MMQRANEGITIYYTKDGVLRDRQRFVDNLGWLLSQTDTGILDVCLDPDDSVRVIYQNGPDRLIDVSDLNYIGIVKEVATFLEHSISTP